MRSRAGIGVLMVAVLAGCGSDARATPSPAVAALTALVEAGHGRGVGDDTIEVWVCHVPADTRAAIYGRLPLRLSLDPAVLANEASARATPFFEAISHGVYRPRFVPGGEVAMALDDEPEDCVRRAIEGSADDTGAVLAVADAEHAPGERGGFGTAGDPCRDRPCGVHDSRRAAYVGGADLAPEWGDDPPMDLVEHEIGHTLGWVHSAVDADGGYRSAIDLMSNSAAPRDVDTTRRDGPDTLAIDRLVSGWLPMSDVVVGETAAGRDQRVTLAPSNGDTGPRLLLLPVDGETLLTVEYLGADGFDAHLPAGGVAVHRVRVRDGVVQPLEPLVGVAPFTDLLQPGATLDSDGWSLVVGDGGRVEARRTAAASFGPET